MRGSARRNSLLPQRSRQLKDIAKAQGEFGRCGAYSAARTGRLEACCERHFEQRCSAAPRWGARQNLTRHHHVDDDGRYGALAAGQRPQERPACRRAMSRLARAVSHPSLF